MAKMVWKMCQLHVDVTLYSFGFELKRKKKLFQASNMASTLFRQK